MGRARHIQHQLHAACNRPAQARGAGKLWRPEAAIRPRRCWPAKGVPAGRQAGSVRLAAAAARLRRRGGRSILWGACRQAGACPPLPTNKRPERAHVCGCAGVDVCVCVWLCALRMCACVCMRAHTPEGSHTQACGKWSQHAQHAPNAGGRHAVRGSHGRRGAPGRIVAWIRSLLRSHCWSCALRSGMSSSGMQLYSLRLTRTSASAARYALPPLLLQREASGVHGRAKGGECTLEPHAHGD
jgi:hypothetical protein